MSKSLAERIPFVKILIVLVIVFALSLGLCGMGFVLDWRGAKVPPAIGRLMGQAVGYELLGMILSAVGILVTVVAWIVAAVVGSFSKKVSQPQNIANDRDDTKLD
jgi:uncharacterized membrane protein